MSVYKLGGWTEQWSTPVDPKFSMFSYFMFGMITNLPELKSGVAGGWGWSPSEHSPPKTPGNGKCMWTYGGAGCAPVDMPKTPEQNNAIVATQQKGWGGVDFDDECNMNADKAYGIIDTMQSLMGHSLETSYTFLAGWDFNNPSQSPEGEIIQTKVKTIAQKDCCNRFALMCYGGAMWDMPTIEQTVPRAVENSIKLIGDNQKIYLALTTSGLNSDNLEFFLNQVTRSDLGGLFVWRFEALQSDALDTMCTRLNISS